MNNGMDAESVIDIVRLLEEQKIKVIIDGGWGVDALLERQTRAHDDLDIAIDHDHAQLIRRVLKSHGFRETPRNDSHEYNFVMEDEKGRSIDIHTFHFDESGNLTKGLDYPYDSIGGNGTINGFRVHCITPEWMVKFHAGYKLDENDYRDVKALCEHFGYELPSEFNEFENSKE